MHWHVKADKFCKKFDSAQKALIFAESFFKKNPYREVIVEACGTKACFALLKHRSKNYNQNLKYKPN